MVIPLAWSYLSWRFEGLEKIPRSGPALIACNHASYLDPIANAYAVVKAGRRPRFLSKEELFQAPLLKWALPGLRQIPVRRGSGDRGALAQAERALAAGEVVVIYPEGTVTTREDGLPMQGKTGTVRIALAAGVPVIPMASWGSAPVWQKSGPGSLRPRRPVWVKVGDPIDLLAQGDRLEDFASVRAMTAEVMDALTSLVTDLRGRYPQRWAARK
ncbi:MAG: lysophospholipid acyltransferase family protein [Actinomycetota bacterium]